MKIYHSQIMQKIDRLQKDRAHLVKCIAQIDEHIAMLEKANELMQVNPLDNLAEVTSIKCTRYEKMFKGGLKKLAVAVLKSNPKHTYSTEEITREMLIRDNQLDQPAERQIENVRKALAKMAKRGVITKTETQINKRKAVYWQWKLPL